MDERVVLIPSIFYNFINPFIHEIFMKPFRRKLKIAHVNTFYLPTFGGVEKVMEELAQRQVKEGHEVHVFCTDSDKYKRIRKKEEIIDGVFVHRIPYWVKVSLNTYLFPSLLWKFKGKFDIVHTHRCGHDFNLIIGILSKLKGFKHVNTTHCPWTDNSFRPPVTRPFIFLNDLFMNRISFKLMDKVIAITPWELDILHKFIKNKKKIVVIPNGTDKILYKRVKNNQFKKKNIIKEKKLVLFFGRLNPTKGPEMLAKAAINITKKRKDIAFVWVGPDEGKAAEVQKLIKPYKNMKYLGPIKGKDKIAEMYQAADVYVLPSYREGLPLTIFEAMASKLPIVASPVNGVPYEMKEPENGFFAGYGDLKAIEEKILKILDNPKLAKEISENNFRKSKNYDWDNIYQRYMDEYYRLLKK
jgi:glycosyltransferase involved in cell wall biosynthesis